MQLIILDRDGVINEDSDAYIKSPDEWIPIPGSLEAIARLTHAGYRIMVATNQSGIARGLYSMDTLMAIHDKMHHAVRNSGGLIDAVFFCPHGPDDRCACRKPKPGLFEQIAKRLHVTLDDVPAIGDSLRDLQAARAVAAKPILVRTGKGIKTLANPQLDQSIPNYENLAEAVDSILAEQAQAESHLTLSREYTKR